jgi:hypothetical protein
MGGNVWGHVPAQSTAASGASVYIVSQPAPGSTEAPFADAVPRYAAEIGKRF